MLGESSAERVAALMSVHGATLLRVARRVSLCADDAQDAFQRALEIYLRRVDSLDPATEVAWMRVVVRNEALAVRKARSLQVNADDIDFDAHADRDQRALEERMESAERVTRSAEALRHLKRDEAQALMLKAEGLSYDEIGERMGWTYTKVNRCITEGRARFRSVYGGIESGRQCETFAPLLAALALGDAGPDDLLRLRPHLRHCGACRADVRRLHGSRWPAVAAFLPLPGLGLPLPGLVDRLRPSSLKAELYGLFSRLGAADPASAALATGGSRGMGATALVSLCLAGAGAGGYCVAGGPLPDRLVGDTTRPQQRSASASAGTPLVGTNTPPTVAATHQAAGVTPTEASVRPAGGNAERAPVAPRVTARTAADNQRAGSEFEFEGATGSPPSATSAVAPADTRGSSTSTSPSTSTSGDTGDGGRAQRPADGTAVTSASDEFAFER